VPETGQVANVNSRNRTCRGPKRVAANDARQSKNSAAGGRGAPDRTKEKIRYLKIMQKLELLQP
jgi:hypothetical protein